MALTGWDDVPPAAEHGFSTVAPSLREQGKACAYAALGQDPRDFSAAGSVVRWSSTR